MSLGSVESRISELADRPVDAVAVMIDYVNWRGQRSLRRIIPERLYVGEVEWHPGAQWILDAWDLDKQAPRSFAMSGIRQWLGSSETP